MSANKKPIHGQKLKGFQDFTPEFMAVHSQCTDTIRQVGGRFGFQQIDTPALEYAETLLGVGGDTDKQVFRFLDNGGRDIALRYDLTVPFARFVTENYKHLIMPFKKLQIGKVWRAEKPQKGRFREFYQCDFDIIGCQDATADIEVLSAIIESLEQLKVGKLRLQLNHRGILSRLLAKVWPELSPEQEVAALIIIDKLEKIGREKVAEQLAALAPASAADVQAFLDVLTTQDNALTAVQQQLGADDPQLQNLATILEHIQSLYSEVAEVVFTPSIARGLGYYSGMVFETLLVDMPQLGSIASGGRYDSLTQVGKETLPGVGGSIGLDRLLAGLQADARLPKTKTSHVFLAIAQDSARGYALEIARTLRQAGIPAYVCVKIGKLGWQFKQANRLGHEAVITVGEEEHQARTFNLKNMRAGTEERNLPFAECIPKVTQMLAQ